MASAHLHASIVQRSAGQSAVGAAAYAARARMIDERTGEIHDYSRKGSDVMFSFVGLPKDAPERLRDPAQLANAMEARETRKNSQTARKFVTALPHELTPQQREWLVKDFGRENFTRKGLAFLVAIHKPHTHGDQRNFHAHWTVSTRVMDKTGFTDKDRDSNERAALVALRNNWEKLVNRHLERHGHAARISMQTLEAQGIDRTPEIHLGQGAAALERKGFVTDRGDHLREIANDNNRLHIVRDDTKEVLTEPEPEPVSIDRDEQDAAWQDSVDQAGIDAAKEQRQAIYAAMATERQQFENQAREMAARHSNAWNEVVERYHDTGASYQSGTVGQAAEATEGAFSFFLSLFTSWAESVTHSMTGKPGKVRPRTAQKTREQEQAERRRQQQQALEALMVEQAEERAAFERRREEMMKRQELARGQFEEPEQKRWGALQTSFDREADFRRAIKGEADRKDVQNDQSGKDKVPQRGGPEML